MSAPDLNRCFKRPSYTPPYANRPQTPPRPFVEPLSPSTSRPTPKPTPIEPNFNYPAINNQISYTVRPELSQNTTPSRVRSYSTSHKNGHYRTPSSTIDDLANAALGRTSPYANSGVRKSSVTFESGHSHAHPRTHHYYHPGSEPPHKRTRSEIIPPHNMGQYASRPATSYESSQQHDYRKMEGAALLLHLQSGGMPEKRAAPPPPTQPHTHGRPHSHSFTQRMPQRPEMRPPPPLLPPFNLQQSHAPTLPSPRPRSTHSSMDAVNGEKQVREDVEMVDATPTKFQGPAAVATQPLYSEAATDEHRSREMSADVAPSENSDAPKRRGWPKGKPRGSGPRKSIAEKVTKKKASKKTPDVKARKLHGPTGTEQPKERRKSFDDALAPLASYRRSTLPKPPARAASVPADIPMTIRDKTEPAKKKHTLRAETVCGVCESSKVRAQKGELDEWICCNGCKKWFHFDCAGFKKSHEVRDVDKYFCAVCEPSHGKTTYVRKSTRAHASVDYAELQRGVLKTSEESVEHHYIQPIKDSTFQFDPETFPRIGPEMVTRDFFEKSGMFTEPICIPADWNPRPWKQARHGDTAPTTNGAEHENDQMEDLATEHFEYEERSDNGQDRLEMIMPEGLTVRQVCNLVGPDWPIDVIDVKTQNSGAKWNLSRWADYYEEQSDEKAIRNVISLEVSQTKLGRLLQRPKIVRDIDLQDDVWPQEEIDKGKFPKVQFYCLMSVADSYTDFHIDFGGSSVYYHILKGKKTFFFIPPKPKHLKAYEEWNDSPQQNYTFLPSITGECYRVDLGEGDTMLIPSGWIHAVWTPEDSLVIGGNFLNRLSYRNQFKVVDIEKANETPMKFRYPFFQKIMWYTALKYLKEDPLPQEVSELFHSGKRFERGLPVWADFDGVTRNESRPPDKNARYYSQAEIEGLPDLVNYIFRTVMIVMGRVEGFTQDRIKRINASIPKGHGEPLELAKTFALWCAWKRGNEDPPNWAHPDAVLPNSKDEGKPKKLSERKLKELEKKEAIAAWRVAPDRQSTRVIQKTQAAEAAAAAAEISASSHPDTFAFTSTTSHPPDIHQTQPGYHQMHAEMHQDGSMAPPQAASPAAFMIPGHFISTPKTSVLGPKRVACDTCRKRRIRCKHKDLVTEADMSPPNGFGGHFDGAGGFGSGLAHDLHDNITVTPVRQRAEHATFENAGLSEQQGQPNGMGGHVPGTNAYVNANIPMTMNGVSLYGEAPKRGRTKACYECRKSKRRCIHDEHGNVDQAKASEPPVPRSAGGSKKRANGEDGSPMPAKKIKQQEPTPPFGQGQPRPIEMQQHGTPFGQLRPQPAPKPAAPQPQSTPSAHQQQPVQHPVQQAPQQSTQQPAQQHIPQFSQPSEESHSQAPIQHLQHEIDPNLFSLYTESDRDEPYHSSHYPWPGTDQPQPYHQRPQSSGYNMPSLEQIANEVLVDMTDPQEQNATALERSLQLFHNADTAPMTNGDHHPKPDESVDSAVSLPAADASVEAPAENGVANGVAVSDAKDNATAQVSIEPSDAALTATHQPDARRQSSASKSGVEGLPLYQPPAPVSQSPEVSKRQPTLTNGVSHGSPPAVADATAGKRKRESTSVTPGSAKKARMSLQGGPESAIAEGDEVDKETLELARSLQAQDRGLRRRSQA